MGFREPVDDRNPALPQGPQTVGIMVYSLLWGNAGFISSSVVLQYATFKLLVSDSLVVIRKLNLLCSWLVGKVRKSESYHKLVMVIWVVV